MEPGWLPVSVRFRGTGADVLWADMAGARWDRYAFFDQTVMAHVADSGAKGVRRTPLSHLLDMPQRGQPSGLIFHLSRSGSTLLTHMLAVLSRHRVLSEPDPLDDVLRADLPDDLRIDLVAAVLSALARGCGPSDGPCFVKVDPWHVLDLPTIRRACPEVPWAFVYRDPLEVVVSHHERPGIQLTDPDLAVVLERCQVHLAGLPPLVATGRYLQAIAGRAIEGLDALGQLVEYDELPGMLPDLLGHFGLDYSVPEMTAMLAGSEADAKRPGRQFLPDGESKRAMATAQMRAIADELADAYRRLEELRSAQDVLRRAGSRSGRAGQSMTAARSSIQVS